MQITLSGDSLADVAIERLQLFEPADGYYTAYSGGKDSVVVKHLMEQAGVKYSLEYNHTTLDPPELVRFIRADKTVNNNMPAMTYWQLMRHKGFPPTRQIRYCCGELKERGGEGRFVVTGVRWAESSRRKKSRDVIEFDRYGSQSKKAKENREIFLHSDNHERRRMIENCVIKGKHILNPIIDWSDNDIWEYIHDNDIPYCSLYDEGFKRLGCIGCPLTGQKERLREFERWPKYRDAYIRVFDDLVKNGREEGVYHDYRDGTEAFDFYVENGYLHSKDKDQSQDGKLGDFAQSRKGTQGEPVIKMLGKYCILFTRVYIPQTVYSIMVIE